MTHHCSAAAALLVISAVLGIAQANATDEARAATHKPATGERAAAPADPLGSFALGSSHEPIAVSADTLEFDNRSHVLTYTGTVVVTQGDMKLESKKLTVTLDDAPQTRLKEVVAAGDVRLAKGERWATAGHAVFDQTNRTVVLTESPVLHDGPTNQVSGETVIVYLDEERSEVKGGVKAIIAEPKKPGATDAPRKNAGASEPRHEP